MRHNLLCLTGPPSQTRIYRKHGEFGSKRQRGHVPLVFAQLADLVRDHTLLDLVQGDIGCAQPRVAVRSSTHFVNISITLRCIRCLCVLSVAKPNCLRNLETKKTGILVLYIHRGRSYCVFILRNIRMSRTDYNF